MITLETIKTFLFYFALIAVIMLTIITFIVLQNQIRIIDNQEETTIPITNDTNQKVTHIEDMMSELLLLSKEIQ